MKITCPYCGNTGKISHSVSITPATKDVYVNCQNPQCTARFVVSVSHKYDIMPPQPQFKNLVSELLSKVPEPERNQILKKYALTYQPSLF